MRMALAWVWRRDGAAALVGQEGGGAVPSSEDVLRERLVRDAQTRYGISREEAEAQYVVFRSRHLALI